MAINLTKGHTVNLTKESPNLKRLYIGVGWDPIEASLNMDVDASIICINKEGKKQKLVYYGNLKYHHGAIKHHGDNLTGCGDGDDEKIEVKLDELPEKIACLSIIINIYSAHIRRQDFSCVKNCFVHVDDMKTGKEIVRYEAKRYEENRVGYVLKEALNTEENKPIGDEQTVKEPVGNEEVTH